MIDISYQKNPELYFDYRLGLELLRNIKDEDYSYPEEIVNFHIYTEVKTNKELECVKSFLATQNLEKTRLVIWSDYEIYDNPLLQPYKHLVTFKVYNAREEAKGTLLADHPVWINSDISDTKHYMKSGILRFLVTHKYGGVWADMDMVFLRDFKPILDQEWAYMWGGETDFESFGPCAAMMNFKRQSQHSNVCMEEICTTPIHKDSTILDHMLLAKVYSRQPFSVFPSTFFNTEWLISKVDRPLSEDLENDWFYNRKNTAKDNLFLEAFAWHWHNSSKKTYPIEEGSKFDLLRKRTDTLLYKKGIL
jgi:hypothetical protein